MIRSIIRFLCVAAFVGLALGPGSAAADVPPALAVEGVLTQSNGTPVDGVVKVRLRLYGDENDKTALFEETVPAVAVQDGQFQLRLGEASGPERAAALLSLFADRSSVWLGIQVGADPDELSPRVAFSTAPYAAFAQRCGDAKTLGGKGLAEIASGTPDGSAAITKWTSFPVKISTTSGLVVGGVTSEGRYRRVGDSLEITIQSVLTEKPTAVGFWLWPIPEGFSVDHDNTLVVLGTGLAEQPGVAWHSCAVYVVKGFNSASMYCDGSGGGVTSGNPWALDAGARFWMRYSVPIKQP
jgi:hypothetical protein